MLDDQLRAAESVFEGDEFIEKWSQLDKSQGFSIETAIGTAELLISEARVTAVLRKDQCADHWPELVSQRQAQGIEICFYDEKGDSVGLAEDIILIHIASGLINIQDLDVVRNTASLVFSALHEMVAESVGKRDLLEGKPIFAVSKRYERSPVVRARAIALHGCSCCVCGLNFSESYGSIGDGFIHIHHVERVADSGERAINVREDVVPVCPNCHAMLHTRTPPLKPEELSELLTTRGDS